MYTFASRHVWVCSSNVSYINVWFLTGHSPQLSLPPASASLRAWFKGVSHHTRPEQSLTFIFMWSWICMSKPSVSKQTKNQCNHTYSHHIKCYLEKIIHVSFKLLKLRIFFLELLVWYYSTFKHSVVYDYEQDTKLLNGGSQLKCVSVLSGGFVNTPQALFPGSAGESWRQDPRMTF